MIERASRDVSLFWIDRVNRDGGVAGFEVEPVIIDAKSDIKAYREGALHLMKTAGVLAIFGGYTSASRRAVMPLVELNDGLLFYPASYAGRECWQRIVCTGPIANQQSDDLIAFMGMKFGNRVYFLGSNNVRSQESNRYAKRRLAAFGGEVAGTAYIPIGHGEFEQAFAEIRATEPDWIFSTVIGESDILFRKAYAKAGFSPDTLPTASLTTSEAEVKTMGPPLGEGHFVSAPYFQSIASAANRRFVEAFLGSPLRCRWRDSPYDGGDLSRVFSISSGLSSASSPRGALQPWDRRPCAPRRPGYPFRRMRHRRGRCGSMRTTSTPGWCRKSGASTTRGRWRSSTGVRRPCARNPSFSIRAAAGAGPMGCTCRTVKS